MTFSQTVAVWGIFTGLVFFLCLWTLGYLIMVGAVVATALRGLMPWERAIVIIPAMIILWPVVLGGALSNARTSNDDPDAPPRNDKRPA